MKKVLNILLIILISFMSLSEINAASAKITTSSSTSQVVVGKQFTVTVKVSSSTALGSWEWVIDYDTKKFKLVSGTSYVVDYASNGSKKSASYTYKFKAIGTGTGKIGVKSAGAYSWGESKLSISTSSKSVKVITQEQLEASYSKNNDLKSLSIDGLKLSPTFNKNTLQYTAEAGANTTKINIKASVADSKSKVSGTGQKEVSEGDNKFEIIVTAQNGSTKTYTVIVKVTDPNPIIVTTTDNEKLTVVKRESNLEAPENFEPKQITLNEQTIPSFYNEITGLTLIGLKNENGDIALYIYDEKNNTYTKYTEILLDQLKIYPLSIDESFNTDYKKSTITINDEKFEALIMNNAQFAVIHAKNLNDGKDNYYIYDTKLNTLITYDNTNELKAEKELEKYFNIILLLSAESLLVFIILIGMLISKARRNKKRKRRILEAKKSEENKESKITEEIEETKITEKIKDQTTNIKEELKPKKEECENDKENKNDKDNEIDLKEENIEKQNETYHKKKKKKKKNKYKEKSLSEKLDEL